MGLKAFRNVPSLYAHFWHRKGASFSLSKRRRRVLTHICSLVTRDVTASNAIDYARVTKTAVDGMHFCRSLMTVEDLLVKAAQSREHFRYTRLQTFKTPCKSCKLHNISCYLYPPKAAARTSEKCISCFATKQQDCHGVKTHPNDPGRLYVLLCALHCSTFLTDSDPTWKPPGRSQAVTAKLDRITKRQMKEHQEAGKKREAKAQQDAERNRGASVVVRWHMNLHFLHQSSAHARLKDPFPSAAYKKPCPQEPLDQTAAPLPVLPARPPSVHLISCYIVRSHPSQYQCPHDLLLPHHSLFRELAMSALHRNQQIDHLSKPKGRRK